MAEILEGQVEVMKLTLYALFDESVINQLLQEAEKVGEIQRAHA